MVTLIGVLGDHPPTDPAGFLDFARSLAALVDPPATLLSPRIAMRVLRHDRRTTAGHPQHDTAPAGSDGRW